jgi:cell division protein FtsQ
MPALRSTRGKSKTKTPRRRALPRWVKPAAKMTALVIGMGGLVIGGIIAWKGGALSAAADTVHARVVAASAAFGLTVQDVLVDGRRETARDDILGALSVARGTPLLTVDPEAARARIEALPWVKTAVVERHLPDTIFVRLTERTPVALWQKDGKLAAVDLDGRILTRDDLSRFRDLPIVIGDRAPEAVHSILGVLAAEPDLYHRIEALTYVGARRWDVRLAGGIQIQLPENDPGRAWARLADTDRRDQLLERDISVVDLRLPDRLVVRLANPPPETPTKPGRKGKNA